MRKRIHVIGILLISILIGCESYKEYQINGFEENFTCSISSVEQNSINGINTYKVACENVSDDYNFEYVASSMALFIYNKKIDFLSENDFYDINIKLNSEFNQTWTLEALAIISEKEKLSLKVKEQFVLKKLNKIFDNFTPSLKEGDSLLNFENEYQDLDLEHLTFTDNLLGFNIFRHEVNGKKYCRFFYHLKGDKINNVLLITYLFDEKDVELHGLSFVPFS